MTRDELLQSFKYPAFSETKNQICRRLISIEKNSIRTLNEKSLRISKQLKWEKDLFRPGDWIALTLNSRREITAVELLAPNQSGSFSLEIPRETLGEWEIFLRAVRQFFTNRDFLEVQTPTLVTCPGTEPFLDVFETDFRQGQRKQKYFLPTSPELHLKKIVAAGYGSVFEMRPCFRNGEVSDHHQPEFWMLEWYRPGHNLEAIKKDCHDLVRACAKALKVKNPLKTRDFSMRDLFKKYLDFDLRPTTQASELRALAEKFKLVMPKNSDFDDAFYFLFLEKIENKLAGSELLFVNNYPPSQAALARLTQEGWGDRFEMYWKGMEIANAYHELNDPKIQRQRSQDDLKKRKHLGRQDLQLDEDFFRALEGGMPPTAGIALGLERLFLALTNKKSLTEIRLFPISES